MAESLYRRKPNPSIEGILSARRGMMKESYVHTKNGKSGSVRNPAWVKITGTDKRCKGGGGKYTLPKKAETYDSVYVSPGTKPFPDLESVVLDYGGDWGLARKLSATIKCYKMSDFKEVYKHFLLPGNEVSVRFGYNSDISWGTSQYVELTGFTVATFSFTTGADGTWTCTFDAVSSSTAIKNLDIQAIICNGCDVLSGKGQSGNSGPIRYITGTDKIQHAVKGVAQLIAADAQKNGKLSIDDLEDGEVIGPGGLINYNPGTSYGSEAHIVLYNGDYIRDTIGRLIAWITGKLKDIGYGKSEVESANNQVYVSLGYVIHRIIDDQLLKAFGCGVATNDRPEFNKLKVEFHPKYSKSKVAPGIRSGDPLSVLMLGLGNYMNNSKEGKDFDKDCKNLGAVRCVDGSGNVKLQNIMLHRGVVAAAFSAATTEKEAQADNTDVKNTREEIVNIVEFFDKISEHIASCTGGAISLRLVEDPDNPKKLIVVDQNYGESETIPCYVFDPIRGDGSTRSCEVQSNVGGQEYRAYMFAGTSKKGDAMSALRGCADQVKDSRKAEYDKAKTDIEQLVKNPGNLGKNEFNADEINALKSNMGRMHRNNPSAPTQETLHTPGLSISLTIDGVYGLQPGCAITTTQIPKEWRNGQIPSYFMVTKVVHTFQNSDWATQVDGILAYYPKIQYIPSGI